MEPGKDNSADAPDRIVETFAGRKILVTGGTGFLGKVLIEKFLRCLPEITQIYMLIRPKKSKDSKQRLLEILESPVSFNCHRFFRVFPKHRETRATDREIFTNK